MVSRELCSECYTVLYLSSTESKRCPRSKIADSRKPMILSHASLSHFLHTHFLSLSLSLSHFLHKHALTHTFFIGLSVSLTCMHTYTLSLFFSISLTFAYFPCCFFLSTHTHISLHFFLF